MDKIGLTSNKLKIIAIITMLVDHIGYYFYYMFSDTMYLLTRIIGRISMPIFVFLIVQGYFKTSNIQKYITRIFTYAIITQIAIFSAYLFNHNVVPLYEVKVHGMLNILFSFCLSLCLIYVIDGRHRFFENKFYDYILRITIFALIIAIYIISTIDYKFIIPIMILFMYLNEIIHKKYADFKKYTYYIIPSLIIFLTSLFQEVIGVFSVFSIVFILLYNGKLGRKSNYIKKFFYYIFPLQHFILYMIAMLIYMKLY